MLSMHQSANVYKEINCRWSFVAAARYWWALHEGGATAAFDERLESLRAAREKGKLFVCVEFNSPFPYDSESTTAQSAESFLCPAVVEAGVAARTEWQAQHTHTYTQLGI